MVLRVGVLALVVCACAGKAKMIRMLEDGPADEGYFKVGVLHLQGEIASRRTQQDADALFARNWGRTAPLIRQAAAAGARVVVTPEYGVCGGSLRQDELFASSTTLPATPATGALYRAEDAVVGYLDEASRLADELDLYLVVQVVERDRAQEGDDTRYFNTLCVLDPDGRLIAKYRKINLYLTEILTASRGSETVCFDTPWGRFGLLLCFDAVIPWTVSEIAGAHDVDFFVVASRWQTYVPLPGNTAMNMLATVTGKPVLWSNHRSEWGLAGGAGVIRPGPGNDTDLGMFEEPGVVIANLPIPERTARLPR